MAPKADAPETAELVELFKKIGLTQAKAAEAAKSAKSASTLKTIIETHDLVSKSLDEKQAVLLAALAVQGSKLGDGERSYAVAAILDGRLKTTDQVGGELVGSSGAAVVYVLSELCLHFRGRGRQVLGCPSYPCGRGGI